MITLFGHVYNVAMLANLGVLDLVLSGYDTGINGIIVV